MISRLRRHGPLLALAAVSLVVAIATALPPTRADAHPLGNFTVNRYARLELAPGLISLYYVIDMAEIPAFAEIAASDIDEDGRLDGVESATYLAQRIPRLLDGLRLEVDGDPVAFTAGERSLSFPPGQGGLSTLRLSFAATAPLADGWRDGLAASFTDENYADQVGWKEIVVVGRGGVAVPGAPAADLTAGLTAYPTDLRSAPNLRQVEFRVVAGVTTAGAASPTVETSPRSDRALDGFAALVATKTLTPSFIALSLLAAAAWGAAHALGPGHGKTIVAAYLIGSRGTPRHALILGLAVTAAHTSSVFTLGLIALYASRYFSAEDAYGVLAVASGVLVLTLGASLLTVRLRALLGGQTTEHGHHHNHDSDYAAGHAHGPEHSHLPPASGMKGLLALGVSGGMLPCPTALVVMLGAIALDRVVYGLVLVVAFSAGLAAVLTAVGIAFVLAKRLIGRSTTIQQLVSLRVARIVVRVGPVLSAAAILVLGLLLTGRAAADLL